MFPHRVNKGEGKVSGTHELFLRSSIFRNNHKEPWLGSDDDADAILTCFLTKPAIMPTTLFLSLVSLLSLHALMAFAPAPGPVPRKVSSLCLGKSNQESNSMTRRDTLTSALVSALLVLPTPAVAKCTFLTTDRPRHLKQCHRILPLTLHFP